MITGKGQTFFCRLRQSQCVRLCACTRLADVAAVSLCMDASTEDVGCCSVSESDVGCELLLLFSAAGEADPAPPCV